MGYNQSKEEKEVIISQAGNSGGTTSDVQFGLKYITEIVVIVFIVVVIGYFLWRRCEKRMQKKMRREIIRSRDLIALNIREDQ